MKIKINIFTYLYLLLSLFCGFFKNIIIIFFIIFIHELGHLFFIKIFRYPVKKITIFPFGCLVHINQKINIPIINSLLIAWGGIISQLLLILIVSINRSLFSDYYNLFIMYNFAIIIFNLLPIYPLDGHKILNCILNYFFSYAKSLKISFYISLFGITLMLLYTFWSNNRNYLVIIFVTSEVITMIKNNHLMLNKFYMERLSDDYFYNKISYMKKLNKNKLRLEYKMYGKKGSKYLNERDIILKKIDF